MPDTPFDEVAAAAAGGASPVIIAVARGLNRLEEMTRWLASAVPTFGSRRVEVIEAEELNSRLASGRGVDTVVVVADAAKGDEALLRDRWEHWNTSRERLLEAVSFGHTGSIVLPVTVSRVLAIAAVSPHIFSIATVLGVDGDDAPFKDEESRQAYQAVLAEMEQRYGISTQEMIERTFERQEIPAGGHDLARWQSAAEALRIAGL